uniref:Ig-like domain-containing protein n=1 Tax=Sander lucioperca TaxID=283035 RepID=A0A8C9XAW6_SANLU
MTLHVNILINTCFYLPEPKLITVVEGRDVTLPCCLITKEDLWLTQFIWKKTDDGQQVFLYDNGDLYSDERPGQSEQFKGRVSHFPDELEQGNASIIIRNTMRADSGEYRCSFPSLQKPQMFYIKLHVCDLDFLFSNTDVVFHQFRNLKHSTLRLLLVSTLMKELKMSSHLRTGAWSPPCYLAAASEQT